MLGLPFIAVMANTTSPEKIALIEREGGQCHLVADASEVYEEARRLAEQRGGHYLDQFTYAERATDWRGNNNIAESIFEQMARERHPVPHWVVVGAGTGGTSATIGRFVRYRGLASQVCVVDPEHSAFLPAFCGDDAGVTAACGSRIEGIGRPRVEPSFVPTVVDRMLLVPDAASVAAMRFLTERTGLRGGRLHRHQPLRGAAAGLRDGRAWPGREHRLAAVRRVGAVCRHVPQRRLAHRARVGPRAPPRRAAVGLGRRGLDRLTRLVPSLKDLPALVLRIRQTRVSRRRPR